MEPNGLSIALVGAGYSALFTVDSASSLMTNLDVQEVTVSRALAAMARTHSNLPGRDDGQTWNVENFVRAVNQRVRACGRQNYGCRANLLHASLSPLLESKHKLDGRSKQPGSQ